MRSQRSVRRALCPLLVWEIYCQHMKAKPWVDRAALGRRLGEERDRLGLSQFALAEIGGVAKRTQAAWECGDQVPNAEYLALTADAGLDVMYVVAGRRASQVQPGAIKGLITDQEMALLEDFRNSDLAGRTATLVVAHAFAIRG